MCLSKIVSIWKSKHQSFNALVPFPPGCHSLDPPFQVQHLALPIEWQLLYIPGLLQNLRMIWAQDSWTLHRSSAVSGLPSCPWRCLLGAGGSLLVLPRRAEQNEIGCVGQDSKRRQHFALCRRQLCQPTAFCHGPMDHRASEAPHFSLSTSAAASLADPYSTVLANLGKSCKTYIIFFWVEPWAILSCWWN